MSDTHGHDHAHDIQKSIRRYVAVFVALLAGTGITVGMYYVHLPSVPLTILVAVTIASIKAFLVAGYFMHLISEKKMIYGILGSTAFFLISLMFLIIWAMHDFPHGTVVR